MLLLLSWYNFMITLPSLHPFLHLSYPSPGDVSSGKSTLIDRLCQISKSHPIGGKFPLSGCSLEYRFIDVQDEETDGTLFSLTPPSTWQYTREYKGDIPLYPRLRARDVLVDGSCSNVLVYSTCSSV